MSRIRLTKTRLNEMLGWKAPTPTFKYFTDQSGMTINVRMTPKGSTILFMFKKRYHGKLVVKSIGGYPEMNLDTARYEFNRMLGMLLQTGSVQEEQKESAPPVMTFGELAQDFLEFKKQKVSAVTVRNYAAYLKHLEPIAKEPIDKVNSAFIKEHIFDHISAQGILTQLRTMVKSLGQYAYAMEYLPTNPFAKLNLLVDAGKIEHHATFADDELQDKMTALFEAIKDAPLEDKALLHFHFLVPLRNAEVRSLTVEQTAGATEVTVKTKTWEQFTMPLNTQAQRLIKILTGNRTGGYLFHAKRSVFDELHSPSANNILKRYGITDFVIHSTRSCAMQFLVKETDIKETIASLCLAHKVGNKTEQAYNRGEYLEERRKAMQLWGDFVEKCIGKNIFY